MTVSEEHLNAHYFHVEKPQIESVLADYKSRISDQFKIPKGLRNSVEFWFRIYTQYSSYQIVFYDKDNPSKIYYVQDDRAQLRRGLTPITLAINSENKTKSIRAEINKAFDILVSKPRHKFKQGTVGYNIVKAWGRTPNISWKKLRARVRFQRGQRDFVLAGIQRAQPFNAAIDDVFSYYGLPTELTRIALLESSFQIHAHSKADAVGVWQFLEPSGREYLTIDKTKGIDERLSPIKAAHAAAKMFKRNIRLLNDYALAVIAYNHGPRNLLRIKKKYGAYNISKLLDANNQESPLGYASRNYYAEFLAILHASLYADELYGLQNIQTVFHTKIVTLTKNQNFYEISSAYNVNLHDLKVFNPDVFTLDETLPKGWRVVIPYKKSVAATNESI
jgi:membrane-bound lytic murein transglycosylase D